MIKAFIREHTPHSHWHIDERSTPPDTYKSRTLHVPMDTRTFFDQLQPAEIKANSLPSSYAHQWHQREEKATQIHDNYLKRTPWCDLKAFSMLIPALPAGSRLQLGNSTRYVTPNSSGTRRWTVPMPTGEQVVLMVVPRQPWVPPQHSTGSPR